jgi:hypothetical protein
MPLVVSFKHPTDGWVILLVQKEGSRPGSFSDNSRGRRELIKLMFENGRFEILRTVFGADLEASFTRTVRSPADEILAKLDPGKTYNTKIMTDKTPLLDFRFTHIRAPTAPCRPEPE